MNNMEFFKNLWVAWRQANEHTKQKKKREVRTEAMTALAEEKRRATELREPWVGILRMDVDTNNISEGAFELDWNDIFVARLIKNGYNGRNDQEIVEQWFNNICGNVVAGYYEQEMADPDKRRRTQQKQIDRDITEYQ